MARTKQTSRVHPFLHAERAYKKAWIAAQAKKEKAEEQANSEGTAAKPRQHPLPAAGAIAPPPSPQELEQLLVQFRRKHQVECLPVAPSKPAAAASRLPSRQSLRGRNAVAAEDGAAAAAGSSVTSSSQTAAHPRNEKDDVDEASRDNKKQKMDSNAEATSSVAPSALPPASSSSSSRPQPQISIQLVMRYLPLWDLLTSSRVNGTWRAAADHAMVWAGRSPVLRVSSMDDENPAAPVRFQLFETAEEAEEEDKKGADQLYKPYKEAAAAASQFSLQSQLATLPRSMLARHAAEIHFADRLESSQLGLMLDAFHSTLPALTSIRVSSYWGSKNMSALFSHPLWSRMRHVQLSPCLASFNGEIDEEATNGQDAEREDAEEAEELEQGALPAAWRQIRNGLRRCSDLRSVTLVLGEGSSIYDDRGEDDAVAISVRQLLAGCCSDLGGTGGLESLNIVALWPADPAFIFTDIPFDRMPNLHSLKIELSLRALEIMCAPSVTKHLAALHTFDLKLMQRSDWRGMEDEGVADAVAEAEARSDAAKMFALEEDDEGGPNSQQLQQCRLGAALARLPSLRHLTIRDAGISAYECTDSMLPLRFAQARDAAAFKLLHSYAFISGDGTCYSGPGLAREKEDVGPSASSALVTRTLASSRKATTAAATSSASSSNAVGIAAPPATILCPALTSLHLTCCRGSLLLPDSPDLADLCTEVPQLRSLQLSIHVNFFPDKFDDHAFSWCRSAALQSLRQLRSLSIDRPYWRGEMINGRLLTDLSALASLPELSRVDLPRVCRLRSRADVCDLLTLDE